MILNSYTYVNFMHYNFELFIRLKKNEKNESEIYYNDMRYVVMCKVDPIGKSQ